MIDPFSGKPNFINEQGVKYWLDQSTSDYANRADIYGTRLKGKAFFVERPDGFKTRLFIGETQDILADDQTLDGIATKIDLLKFIKRDKALLREDDDKAKG